MKIILAAVVMAISVSACASSEPYGNYKMLADNKALVSAGGNILVSRMEVEQSLNRRAAEATIEAGYTHYLFENREIDTRSFEGGSRRHDVDASIIMFQPEGAPPGATDARTVR